MSEFCLGCMRPKAGGFVCEHCGFDERQDNLPHQLPLGTVLQNQYLVGKVLGQGGFGITYMGWDKSLSVPVAIKEYFPGGVVQRNTQWGTQVSCANGGTEEAYGRYRDRFLKEARTLAQLARFQEIVQIRSYFSENNTAYIVMEYVQGVTLKSCLKNMGRPMTEKEALEIMQPALKALQKIHHCGVIHRDISPDNIMIHNGGIKLIDFGTVRYMDNEGHSQSTEAILKPGFAPMEQYNTRGNLGTWTDVYAICACFHYLLTGSVPPDVHERLDQGEKLTLLRSRGGISETTVNALEQGMRIRYQERLQTIDELYSLLYTPKARVQEKAAPVTKPAPKKRKKGLAAMAVAAAAAAAVCALFLLPNKEQLEQEAAAPGTEISGSVPGSDGVTAEAMAYAEAETLLAAGETGKAAIAFGKLGDYSDARQRSFALWNQITPRRTVSAKAYITPEGELLGSRESLFRRYEGEKFTTISDMEAAFLRSDGTVILSDPTSAPFAAYAQEVASWRDIVDIRYDRFAQAITGLKSDGTLVVAGYKEIRQEDVSGWTDVVAIDSHRFYSNYQPYQTYDSYLEAGKYLYDCVFGIRSDGTVLSTGKTWFDLSDWKDITAISVSNFHLVGLKSDGTVTAVWYENNQPGILPERYAVSGWKNIVSIDTTDYGTLGLRSDGTMAATGNLRMYGDLDVSGWKNIVAFHAEGRRTVGLRSDGTMVAAGYKAEAVESVNDWSDLVAFETSAGYSDGYTIGIRSDGSILGVGEFQIPGVTVRIPEKTLPYRENRPNTPEEIAEAPSDQQAQYDAAEALLAAGETGKAAIAFGKLGDYSDARQRSLALWDQVAVRDTIVAMPDGTAGLKNDGTVLLIGDEPSKFNSQRWDNMKEDVKAWSDIIAISGSRLLLGLKEDGTVIVAGPDERDSELLDELLEWKDIVSISVSDFGGYFGLKMDGTLRVAFSGNTEPAEWTDLVAVSAGTYHVVGLRSDGTVVAAGEPNVEKFWTGIEQWRNIIAIEAGCSGGIFGLKTDGTLESVGPYQINGDWYEKGKCDVSQWTDIVAFTTGGKQVIGVKSDGSVVAVGYNLDGCLGVTKWKDIVAVDFGDSANGRHTVGLKSDGTMVAVGANDFGQCRVKDWTDIKLPAKPDAPAQTFQQEREGNVMMEDWAPTVTTTGDAYNYYPKSNLLGSDIKRNKVKSLTFLDSLAEAPSDAWDVSRDQDGSVLAWTGKSTVNNNYYDLYIGAEGGVTAPEYCSYLFSGYVNLREIHFNGFFDTSDTVSMQMMFHNCPSLKSIDVSSLDTSNVTDMYGMFLRCEGLTELDVSSLDTSSVTDMSCMFWECRNLRRLNVSGFQTSNVTDMSYMFCDCESLTALDISGFDTGNVVYMGWMFSQCSKLTDLNVGQFDTSSVRDYQNFIYDGKIINGKPWRELFT